MRRRPMFWSPWNPASSLSGDPVVTELARISLETGDSTTNDPAAIVEEVDAAPSTDALDDVDSKQPTVAWPAGWERSEEDSDDAEETEAGLNVSIDVDPTQASVTLATESEVPLSAEIDGQTLARAPPQITLVQTLGDLDENESSKTVLEDGSLLGISGSDATLSDSDAS
ncbi:MAG: hypothetical protein O7H39_13065 [Gammaproteobacteria bacterium]|nr:hypothetical protein [Gammaproteobacteria bacterium]